VPRLLRPGLEALPPQGQVRGARMAAGFVAAGVAVLLVGTVVQADRHPWTVPFALVTVTALLGLGLLRQVAAVGETRRLYRQVEEASDERRRLLRQLLERAGHERRHFAGQLYEQAMAAYASFSVMAGSGELHARSPAVAAEVSARVGGDFARKAEWVRELVLAIRPADGEPDGTERLAVPIRAYLADIYGDRPAPRLTVEVADGLALDWMTGTVVLQIVQQALDNVCHHSRATGVEVTLGVDVEGSAVRLRVVDDGVGFDPRAVPEGSGLATMRASVAVARGTLAVESRPGDGTAITARLGFGGPDATVSGAPLRLVPREAD
jgi:signal transduction histidine kinase